MEVSTFLISLKQFNSQLQNKGDGVTTGKKQKNKKQKRTSISKSNRL